MLPMKALLAFKGASQMNKLTCCVAVAVAGLGGQEASDWNLGFWEGRYTRVRKARR